MSRRREVPVDPFYGYPVYDHQVKTTKTSDYEGRRDEGMKYFVMSPNTKRTWCDFNGAIDHAANLIDKGNNDEFLVVKVVARVKRKRTPVEVLPP